jgi:hypothetical protein
MDGDGSTTVPRFYGFPLLPGTVEGRLIPDWGRESTSSVSGLSPMTTDGSHAQSMLSPVRSMMRERHLQLVESHFPQCNCVLVQVYLH